MHVAVANRLSAEKVSSLIRTPHAIVSITDPDKAPATFAHNQNRVGILALQVYDLEDIRDDMPLEDAAAYVTMFGHGLFHMCRRFKLLTLWRALKTRSMGFSFIARRVFQDPRQSPRQ
jgi:hypothetical protein